MTDVHAAAATFRLSVAPMIDWRDLSKYHKTDKGLPAYAETM